MRVNDREYMRDDEYMRELAEERDKYPRLYFKVGDLRTRTKHAIHVKAINFLMAVSNDKVLEVKDERKRAIRLKPLGGLADCADDLSKLSLDAIMAIYWIGPDIGRELFRLFSLLKAHDAQEKPPVVQEKPPVVHHEQVAKRARTGESPQAADVKADCIP